MESRSGTIGMWYYVSELPGKRWSFHKTASEAAQGVYETISYDSFKSVSNKDDACSSVMVIRLYALCVGELVTKVGMQF